MKKLVLIDGKSVFYRGYYAMGALGLADGTPTGGVYGFAAIAMEIVKKINPDKVIVAWDSKSSTAKRRALYPEYKAGRVKPGEDFYAQIPLLKELIDDLGWSFIEIDNYEADDIIGTLSRQADETMDKNGKCEWETYIISSDLDMLQIVDDNTRMWRILKGFSNIEEIDVAEVEAKYGILKSQFLDLKALKGDSSDNIPGVPGVGEKTAVKLLNEYGDLDNIYANLDKIKGAMAKKLADGKESAYMSRELARIMFDAPVKLSEIPDFVFDRERVVDGLRKLEFRSLIRKVEKSFSKNEDSDAHDFRHAASRPSTLWVVRSSSSRNSEQARSSLDFSGGLSRGSLPLPLSRMVSNHTQSDSSSCSNDVPNLLESSNSSLHPNSLGSSNSSFCDNYPDDIQIIDWDVKGLMHEKTEIAERILSGEKFWDLGQAEFLLNPLARGQSDRYDPMDVQMAYKMQRQEMEKMPKLFKVYTDLDLPLIPVLYKMEKKGMLIDRDYFARLKQEYDEEAQGLEQEIWKLAGKEFNVNSPVQLSEVLFGDLGLPTKGIKKTTRGFSTGAKELEKLKDAHPIVLKLMEYREAAKLLGTYITPMPELADDRGRIHTTFTQNVTATGRLSSKDPNLQNIPVRTEAGKRIRTGFVAPEGKMIVSADYSQFELRLAAVLAGDRALIDDFNRDVDVHTKTASEAFKVPFEQVTKAQRRAAKVINFGILYGMSVKGLSEAAKMPIGEAKQFIDNYFEMRAPIKRYLDEILRQAREDGFVETHYGRRRPTPDVKSTNFIIRQAAERAAQNMPIQGTEADLMKRAMIVVDESLPKGAELIMQVHDSLMVECGAEQVDEVSGILKEKMEKIAPELPIKLAVDVTSGENWGEL